LTATFFVVVAEKFKVSVPVDSLMVSLPRKLSVSKE